MQYFYCLGIRVNDVFQEYACKVRDYCPYYRNADLSKAFTQPDVYAELDTYNNKQCQYETSCISHQENSNSQRKSDYSDFLTCAASHR